MLFYYNSISLSSFIRKWYQIYSCTLSLSKIGNFKTIGGSSSGPEALLVDKLFSKLVSN